MKIKSLKGWIHIGSSGLFLTLYLNLRYLLLAIFYLYIRKMLYICTHFLKVLNMVSDRLTSKKIAYVILWSVGLFVATFFTFCGSFKFATMAKMTALDLAKDYLFPLFLAMALFLIDAQYVMITEGRQLSLVFLGCFIFFILATVVSVLVNHAIWGWVFFIAAWIALTVLKASMILDVSGIEIDNK